MSEPFKIRPQIVEKTVPLPEIKVTKDVYEGIDPDTDAFQDAPEDFLEAYEAEKGHRISEDYFNARELMCDDFNLKMNVYAVDKYVKNYMREHELKYDVNNFYQVLEKIEAEIGTADMDIIARLRKLAGYTKLMTKLKKINEDRAKYLGV